MVTKLNTPFTVTVTGSRIAITYSATYASVTFSGATATVTAHPTNTRTTAIADLGVLNTHTVLWDMCTDPVSSDRNDFIANVEALISGSSEGDVSIGGTLTVADISTSGNHAVGGVVSTTNLNASGYITVGQGAYVDPGLLLRESAGFIDVDSGEVALWANDSALYMTIREGATRVPRIIAPVYSPAAEITRTSTQTFSSVTYFDCDRVDYDPSSMVGSTGSPAYSYFQVPLAGMYHIQIRLHVGSSSAALCYLQTAANNTFATSMTQRNANHQTGYMTMSWLRYIPADYYVRCAALQSGGSATTFGSSSVEHQYIGMSIAWVG
jgi:hypothetical protein